MFLGGTCNNSTWRKKFIELLGEDIDYFNPVVDDWTPECYEEELIQREICDFVLYVITPAMLGVYSIAEVVDDSNKRPEKTIFCFLPQDDVSDFNKAQIKSLSAVGKMVAINGGFWASSFSDVIGFLKSKARQ